MAMLTPVPDNYSILKFPVHFLVCDHPDRISVLNDTTSTHSSLARCSIAFFTCEDSIELCYTGYLVV